MENRITVDCDCPNCDNEFEQTVVDFEYIVCPACDYTFECDDLADFVRLL